MGFDGGQMVLDNPNGVYYSGETVRGNLIFYQDSVKTFRGIYVKLRGFCNVHWTTTETRRVDDRDETYTKNHDSYEEYINTKIYLIGGESGEHQIQPGNYDYPFTFHLPANCPSSFEGQYGHIRYEIKAVVDRAFKFNQEKRVAVRVMTHLDLNRDPYCREPIEMEISATYCCCCFSSGATDTAINAPMSGYCPGQKIPIEITCANKGTVDIGQVRLSIVKTIDFIATNQPDRRSEKYIVAEIVKGSVLGNTTRNWTVDMEVPTSDIYNLTVCKFIEINYKFEVIVFPNGCHNKSRESRKIIIGTIPLVGFQDNILNPLQEQMSQQISAVTQQPLPSYSDRNAACPTNSPYQDNPKPNPPYPVTSPQLNINPPYSPNDFYKPLYGADNTPYTPADQPYPTNDVSKSPYPAANPPYPLGTPSTVTNPPYPTNDISKTPYPTANSPYPTANRPYPVGTPSTITNPPYPSENSPFDNPPPYPGNNLSYPATQQNTPNQMGSMLGTESSMFGGRLLKTGNIGFNVQSNVRNMPFPGKAAALPISPVPVDPYSGASAPALDSPDIEKKKENE